MKTILKSIVRSIPFKKEIYSTVRQFWHPPERVYRHLYFNGDFEVDANESSSFKVRHYGFHLENEVFWDGLEKGHESVSYSLWKKLLRNSDIVFDIGANTGMYSLIAKSIRPQAKVFAFEPIARVFEKLTTNIELNSFDTIAIDKAASNFNGEAKIFDTDSEHIYVASVNANMHPPEAGKIIEKTIKTVRVDTIIEQYDLPKIDLMKIDVETHEPEVLEGMGQYLKKFKPNMLIEILNDDIGRRVEEIVKECDYIFFNIDDGAKKLRQVKTITKSDFWNYLLCSRKSAEQIGLLQ